MTGMSWWRLVGWSAYCGAAAHVVATATVIGLLVAGEPFRSMNDGALVLFGLALAPVAVGLYRLHRQRSPAPALLATLAGLTGLALLAGFSLALLSGAMRFEESSGVFFLANGLIGLWLLAIGLIARADHALPRRLSWFTIAAGIGQLLYVPAIVAVPVWAVRLGRTLLPPPAAAPASRILADY